MTNKEKIAQLEEELALRKGIEETKEQLAQMQYEMAEFKKFAYTEMIQKGRITIEDVPENFREEVSARLVV